MTRAPHLFWLWLLAILLMATPCPAPLIYVPGEGWRYEPVGEGGKWVRTTPKEQLEVAKESFEAKRYGRALKAARRTVKVWPFSDHAPGAQYLVGRCLEAKHNDQKAFDSYQQLIERYPKLTNFTEILDRQFTIANRFLDGQRYRLWGLFPLFPSMDKTIKLYEKIIKNGPYSDVAPQAQLHIAEAHLKKMSKDYTAAAKAYEAAADRYTDKPGGIDGLFLAGETYYRQAKTAEYDQSVAARSIATFTDFITLYPTEQRIERARDYIKLLKTEQARGSYDVARFYEKKRKWDGALVYYNEVLLKDPESTYAGRARERIDSIKRRQEP